MTIIISYKKVQENVWNYKKKDMKSAVLYTKEY